MKHFMAKKAFKKDNCSDGRNKKWSEQKKEFCFGD